MSEEGEGFIERGLSEDCRFQLVRFTGTLDARDIALMSPPYPEHRTDGVTLFDTRPAVIDISYEDAKSLSRTISDQRETRKRRAAFLVKGDFQYALARMYISGAGTHYEEQNVFHSLEEVLAWLDVDPLTYAEAEAALERVSPG